MSNSEDKEKNEVFYKAIYDLEIALKSQKNDDGTQMYSEEYIDSILKNLSKLFETKKLKLVKKPL